VLVVALIVVFPYLPGSQSDAFKGVSVFVGILEEPKPYILQTSLDDSYFSYQLNASTDRPNDIHLTYARLHENIQNQFNAGGIEILSPQYAALRDGNKITIPDSRPAADHHAPAFRVQTFPSGG